MDTETAINAEMSAIENQIALLKRRLSALKTAKHALATLTEPPSLKGLAIGDIVHDGSIYLGPSATTKQPLFVMPYDCIGQHDWAGAQEVAADHKYANHENWRLPTIDELNILFKHRHAVPDLRQEWYWSSSDFIPNEQNNRAFSKAMTNGTVHAFKKTNLFQVRLIRDGAAQS
jgi:hypothetical protein